MFGYSKCMLLAKAVVAAAAALQPLSDPAHKPAPAALARSIFYPNFNVTSFTAYAVAAGTSDLGTYQNDSAMYSFTVQWSQAAPDSFCNTTVPSPNRTLADVATTQCTGIVDYVPAFRWTNQNDGTALLAFQVLYVNSINGIAATYAFNATDIVWGDAKTDAPSSDGEGSQGADGGEASPVRVQRYVGPEAFEMAPIPV